MSLTELPVIDLPRPAKVDLRAPHQALAESISTHDVRYDRLTRRSTRRMPASTRSYRCWSPSRPMRPMSWRRSRSARRFGVPITARGGGTSQAGQSIGPGVILDCSKHFDRVLEINAAERWVRVEPGCVLDELNRALKPHGLLFAPDISTSNRATIGGMIANNSSGARSVLYGKTIDHVLAMKVVLSDGSVVELGAALGVGGRGAMRPRESRRGLLPCHPTAWPPSMPRRSTAGSRRSSGAWEAIISTHSSHERSKAPTPANDPSPFNLARLFIGSEGTLGVTVEAKLRLVELPKPGPRSSSSSPVCSRPWRRRRSSCGIIPRRSKSWTGTCSTAPASIPRRAGSATSSKAIPPPSS